MKKTNIKIKIVSFVLLVILTIILLAPRNIESKEALQPIPEYTTNLQYIEPIRDHATDLEKAIALAENNGDLSNCANKPGLSGEIGCHQYLPSTWIAYSREVLGYVAKQTNENSIRVTRLKMQLFIDQGYTDEQIFLIWNSGKPNKCSKGINYKINPKGVPYDSCTYVTKAFKYLNIIKNS